MGARFVRLGIAGFKSFADPISLDILPGLTGIVGPNGCGKSNVTEALRWAMGEQNVRHLRGGDMDDVIFAGTAHRPGRNLAEVSLSLEPDGTPLPPPFAGHSELEIVRRIARGAGSTYRVNGREARARDVQTLLADLASGARTSAMVSQGRVSALVSARPEERRAVLEEAAGITGLHTRRAEAETRLRAAEANLQRAEERRAALAKHHDALAMQAAQAAAYRTVAHATLAAEAALLAIRLHRAELACTRAGAEQRTAAAAIDGRIDAAAQARAGADRLHAALPRLRDAEADARAALDRARAAQQALAAEAARNDAVLAAARQRQQHIGRDLAYAETALRDAAGADTRLAAEHDRLHAEAALHPAALAAAEREAGSAATALHAADAAALQTADHAAEAAARSSTLQHLLDQAQARARRAHDAASRLDAERARTLAQHIDPAALATAAAAHQAAERALAAAQAAHHRAEAGHAAATQAATAARDAHARANAGHHTLQAEASALADVLGVRDDARWPPMTDRLAVPPGLEAALGAALGEELGAAADPGAPRHWRTLPPHDGPAPPGRPLGALVQGPAALHRALASIGLVDDEASGAAAQAQLRPGQCLVSPAGAVWRWDGYTVRAGTPTAASVRLTQRNRLAILHGRLAASATGLAAASLAHATAQRAEQAACAAERAARVARGVAEAERARTQAAATDMRARAEAAAARLATLDEQHAAGTEEREAALAAHAAAQHAHATRPDPAAARHAAEAARATMRAARARDTAASRALDDLRRAGHARDARLGHIGADRAERRHRATDLRHRMTDLLARSAEAAAEHDRLAAAPAQAARDAGQAHAACVTAEAAHRGAHATREAAERELDAAAATARAAEHAAFAARQALAVAQAGLVAAQEGLATANARVAERAGALPPLPATTEATAAAEDRARTRLHRLERERDQIGPVNLRAETEARMLEAELGQLLRDRDELATAIAKLRGSIGHLNREGRARLSAVFEQIDRQFQALFARMFGGGRACLALVGSDDPLLAGLEIYAQPPGKTLAALSLLSGGEQALTALSLIFAVFRCNPAPLCILDEVDAPLDDPNVERFCALLADMVSETGTRFMVVTHHQLTMARMDRLYGVTMQERGVSRLLSVNLSRAMGMTDAIAAE